MNKYDSLPAPCRTTQGPVYSPSNQRLYRRMNPRAVSAPTRARCAEAGEAPPPTCPKYSAETIELSKG